jgi:hypothetical protein
MLVNVVERISNFNLLQNMDFITYMIIYVYVVVIYFLVEII